MPFRMYAMDMFFFLFFSTILQKSAFVSNSILFALLPQFYSIDMKFQNGNKNVLDILKSFHSF